MQLEPEHIIYSAIASAFAFVWRWITTVNQILRNTYTKKEVDALVEKQSIAVKDSVDRVEESIKQHRLESKADMIRLHDKLDRMRDRND